MNKLSSDQIVEIHARLTNQTPNSFQVDKVDSILSTVYQQNNRFFYVYRDSAEKAAKLACEIVLRKPFLGNNMATAVFASFMLLQVNGIKLSDYENDLKSFIAYIQSNNQPGAAEWIREHHTYKYAEIVHC